MIDPFRAYMKRVPEFEFSDHPLEELSLDALSPFGDGKGNFTKSFDVTLKGQEIFREIWILSTCAQYESDGEAMPAVQIRLIDDEGATLYYSPVYEIGHRREYYRREWRVPPAIKCYDSVRLSFIIPEGVILHLDEIRAKKNTRYIPNDFGIRFHGHAGFPGYAASNSVFGFQMAAEMGFPTCITIPKFTKEGLGVCFHDDASIRKIVRYRDGSCVEEGAADDKPVCEFTYEELMKFDVGMKRSSIYEGTRIPTLDEFFRICSLTGMNPIFSVHPDLTAPEWEKVGILLDKYRLGGKFWVKSGHPRCQKLAYEVLGDRVGGSILLQGIKSDWDPAEQTKLCGLSPDRHNIVIEYFFINYMELTEDFIDRKLKLAHDEGFNTSIAAMRGGISGACLKKFIEQGVSEFTVDHHASMGLDW